MFSGGYVHSEKVLYYCFKVFVKNLHEPEML